MFLLCNQQANFHLAAKHFCFSLQAGVRGFLCENHLEMLAVPTQAMLCRPLQAQNVSETAPRASALCAGV